MLPPLFLEKNKAFTMAHLLYTICISFPPPGSTMPLPGFWPHLLLLFSLLSMIQPHWPHFCSMHMPRMLPPQGLCTSDSLSWNVSISNVPVAFLFQLSYLPRERLSLITLFKIVTSLPLISLLGFSFLQYSSPSNNFFFFYLNSSNM